MGNDPDTGIRFDLGDGVFPRESNVEQAHVEQTEMKARPRLKPVDRLVHIGVRLPESMVAEIAVLAKASNDGSWSGVIRGLLRQALAAHRR